MAALGTQGPACRPGRVSSLRHWVPDPGGAPSVQEEEQPLYLGTSLPQGLGRKGGQCRRWQDGLDLRGRGARRGLALCEQVPPDPRGWGWERHCRVPGALDKCQKETGC